MDFLDNIFYRKLHYLTSWIDCSNCRSADLPTSWLARAQPQGRGWHNCIFSDFFHWNLATKKSPLPFTFYFFWVSFKTFPFFFHASMLNSGSLLGRSLCRCCANGVLASIGCAENACLEKHCEHGFDMWKLNLKLISRLQAQPILCFLTKPTPIPSASWESLKDSP